MSKAALDFCYTPPPKNYKISSAFSYNFRLALTVNKHQRVLVTPKAVRLAPGKLVEVDGVPWPITTPYELDPHKNEYAVERTVDL